MPPLKLPLWFVTDKEPKGLDEPPRNEAPATLAFTDRLKLNAFLAHTKTDAYEVATARSREGLIAVVADLQLRGENAVYVDPDIDGHGGRCVYLTDLIRVE